MEVKKSGRKSRQKSPERKKILTRLLVLGLVFWGLVSACNQINNSPVTPDTQQPSSAFSSENFNINQNTITPEILFLSFVTGYKPEQLAAITNANHRDIFSIILSANGESIGISDAIPKIGVADCSDARVCLPRSFTNVSTKASIIGDLPDPITGQTLTISKIGAQPSLFPVEINQTVFIPHCSGASIPGGCGALGGVEALVNSEEGVVKLMHHGVSQMTIDDINNLIKMGAGTTPSEIASIEEAWAKTGARMQAEINHAQYLRLNPGAVDRTYFAGYAVHGHTDGSLTKMKVIDNNGIIYSVDDFPLLKAYGDFINVPHPVIESLMTQAPDIIAINGSRLHDTNKLFGELAQKPGVLFKSSVNMTPGVPISVEEAKAVIAGGDYAVGALKNSKFMVLVADNAADMAVLRTTLMTEGLQNGSMRAFFEQGGIIVEMYPDETGRFTGLANIVTAEDLSADLAKLNVLTSSRVASTVAIENSFLGQIEKRALRDLELNVITESQFFKIQGVLRSIRPFVPFFKFGADAAATYFTVRDVGTWIDESVMGHSLIWDNPTDRTVWNFNNPIIYTEDQNRIRAENYGAHPYLIEGRLDRIDVFQDDLVQAYSGAIRAYIERGPGMPNAADPWDKMASADVGKLLTLEILPPYGPADGPPLKLITTLVMKPNDENFDGQDVIYDNTNPNQRMMLVDQMTGLPIFGDIGGQNTIVVAFDPSNPDVRYLFEVSVPLTNPQDPNSVDRKFVFKFVGVAPAQKEQSNLQDFEGQLDQIFQELDASPGIPVGYFGIPVGPETIFGHVPAKEDEEAFFS